MARWFRFYDDALNDPKVQRLPGEKFKLWVNLLCIASKNEGALPPIADLAFLLRQGEDEVAAILDYFADQGLIDHVEGTYEPHNWKERQFKSDVADPTAAKRQKTYRERNAHRNGDRNATVTVTAPRAETEQIQSRADTRTDSEKVLGNFCQAIVRAYAETGSASLPDTSRAQLWLAKGYDPEICLAVIRTVVKRQPNAGLAYFDKPIDEAHRTKAPPRIALVEPPRFDWDAAAKSWISFRRWPKGHGNDPESVGCVCPREILEKHGIAAGAA